MTAPTRPEMVFEIDALRQAVRELHEFMCAELDPDPSPVEDYISDPDAKKAAKRAIARGLFPVKP